MIDVFQKICQSDEEREAVQALKDRILPFLGKEGDDAATEVKQTIHPGEADFLNDITFFRYCKARSFNVDDAEEMIWKTLAWRRDYEPHKITREDIEVECQNEGKMYLSRYGAAEGRDKDGRVLIIMVPRRDPHTSPDDVRVKYLVWILERAIALSREMETGIFQVNVLVDFKDTGASVGGISVSLECLHILNDHYPERLGVALMLNTSFLFNVFWRVLTPFLQEGTKQKIKFGKDHGGTSKLCLAHINEDILEEEFGGKSQFKFSHDDWVEFEERYEEQRQRQSECSASEEDSAREKKKKKKKKKKKENKEEKLID